MEEKIRPKIEEYDFDIWKKNYKHISTIGMNDEGGIDRLAFTHTDYMARTELLNNAYGMQLQCYLDSAENLWLYKMGTDPSLPPLVIGSHLDAVPNGGRYDGVLGVMAGFQVLRYLFDYKIEHRRSIELVSFSCEESSRFNLSTIGSKLVSGKLDVEKLKKYKDNDGKTVVDCLDRLETNFKSVEERKEHLKNVFGYIELHIEQGPVLESGNIDIGIVESIAAPIRLKLTIKGHSDHSGACPMDLRRDALTAASEIILAAEELGRQESIHKSVATVGKINVPHQALNVVPGEAEIFVDIRGIDKTSVNRIYHGLQERYHEIAEKRGVSVTEVLLADENPVPMNRELGEIIERNCEKAGLSYKWMASGAGHDAMNIAEVAPTAMIFVPCVGGISHNLQEEVLERDLKNSLLILYEVIMDICQ